MFGAQAYESQLLDVPLHAQAYESQLLAVA